MATLNFDTTVTDWTTNSGSATAVPNSIPKTQFESMLTGLVPQSDFFDRSIVVNASDSYDFRVGSSGNELLHVDNSLSAVGIGGSPVTGYELTVLGNAKIQTDSADSSTELWVDDPNGESFVYVTGATYGTIIGQGASGGSLSLKDTGETNETFQVLNAGGTTDFNIRNGATTIATAMQVDMTTGNVGIGGAAASSSYELKVHGNQQIVGDNSGTTTELVIDDPAAAASLLLQGTTGSSQHIRTTTSGEAEIFLTTTAGTVGSANNSLNIRVSGTSTDFLIYDYDTTNGHSNGQAFLDVDNATGNVGIKGAADTGDYDLKVNGQFRVDNSDGSTEAYIYSGTDTSIVHVKSGHTTGYGQLYLEGGGGAKIDMQDSNASQNNDRFTIMNAGDKVAFDIYDNTESKVHDVIDIDLATGDFRLGAGKLLLNTNTTEAAQIYDFSSTTTDYKYDVDLINGVTLDASLSASGFGTVIQGRNSGHIVNKVMANDTNDGFHVLMPERGTSADVPSGYGDNVDQNAFCVRGNESVFNQSKDARNFRVAGLNNSNLIYAHAATDTVSIGSQDYYKFLYHGWLQSQDINTSTDTFTLQAREDAKAAGTTYYDHLSDGTIIQFGVKGGAAIPAGLTAGTDYYVISSNASNSTFKVSQTENGSAVNITSQGSASIADEEAIQIYFKTDTETTNDTITCRVHGDMHVTANYNGTSQGTEIKVIDYGGPAKMALYGSGVNNETPAILDMQDATNTMYPYQACRMKVADGNMYWQSIDNAGAAVFSTSMSLFPAREANVKSTRSGSSQGETQMKTNSQLVVGGSMSDDPAYRQVGTHSATMVITNNQTNNYNTTSSSTGIIPNHVGLVVENVNPFTTNNDGRSNSNIVVTGRGQNTIQFYDRDAMDPVPAGGSGQTATAGTDGAAYNITQTGNWLSLDGVICARPGATTSTVVVTGSNQNDVGAVYDTVTQNLWRANMKSGQVSHRVMNADTNYNTAANYTGGESLAGAVHSGATWAVDDSVLSPNSVVFFVDGGALKARYKDDAGNLSTFTLS